jgi:hypothetical protein
MRDVTPSFHAYREGVRHLWNTQFLSVVRTATDKWMLRDIFDDVCASLFAALVLEPLRVAVAENAVGALPAGRAAAPRPMLQFHVMPAGPRAPIHINRDLPRGGYWDHPPTMLLPGEADLRFVRWFDFDPLGFRDFRYYEVHIVSSSVHAEISGRVALIECEHSAVYLDVAADAESGGSLSPERVGSG